MAVGKYEPHDAVGNADIRLPSEVLSAFEYIVVLGAQINELFSKFDMQFARLHVLTDGQVY